MHQKCRFYSRYVVLGAVSLALAAPSSALAQDGAAVDQYQPQPPPYQPYQPYQPYSPYQPGAGGTQQQVAGEQGGGGAGGGAADTAGEQAQAGGGELPFTGYPMTTLAWVMLGLVAGGIALRLIVGGALRLRRTY